MAFCNRSTQILRFSLLAVFAANAFPQAPTIVQPGAPGEAGKLLKEAPARPRAVAPPKADVDFMQGMIMHHSQAVEMTALMAARTRNKALLEMGKRISISQTDEIRYMKQWLEQRGQSAEMAMPEMKAPDMKSHDMQGMDMANMHDMAGMHHDMAGMKHDMSSMNMADDMPPMPGMLTKKQMAALAKASGPAFDHLFLTGMIQHHTGALIMVKDLFDNPGAGEDPVLFDFATDIDNTQRAEIRIMQGMLDKEKKK